MIRSDVDIHDIEQMNEAYNHPISNAEHYNSSSFLSLRKLVNHYYNPARQNKRRSGCRTLKPEKTIAGRRDRGFQRVR